MKTTFVLFVFVLLHTLCIYNRVDALRISRRRMNNNEPKRPEYHLHDKSSEVESDSSNDSDDDHADHGPFKPSGKHSSHGGSGHGDGKYKPLENQNALNRKWKQYDRLIMPRNFKPRADTRKKSNRKENNGKKNNNPTNNRNNKWIKTACEKGNKGSVCELLNSTSSWIDAQKCVEHSIKLNKTWWKDNGANIISLIIKIINTTTTTTTTTTHAVTTNKPPKVELDVTMKPTTTVSQSVAQPDTKDTDTNTST